MKTRIQSSIPLIRDGKGGFTLLEVMIAVVILAFALLGLAGLQVVAVQGSGLANQITEATTLAQDRLEQLIATPFGDLADDTTNETRNGVTYTIVSTVVPDAGNTRADVTVQVSWIDGRTSVSADSSHSVTVNSVISEF